MGTSFLFWSRNRHKPENLWAEETFFFWRPFLLFFASEAPDQAPREPNLADGRTDGPKSFLLFSWRRYLGEVPTCLFWFILFYCWGVTLWTDFKKRLPTGGERRSMFLDLGLWTPESGSFDYKFEIFAKKTSLQLDSRLWKRSSSIKKLQIWPHERIC